MASSHIANCCTPLTSERLNQFQCSKFPPSLRNGRASRSYVKCVAEKRDNLDHLQRTTHQQTQPKTAPQIAPTGPWDRFPAARTVQQMMDSMERMMEDPFAYTTTWPSVSSTGRDGYNRRRTPWAIKEGEKEYKMRFDMPGMTKDDVKVSVEEKMLVIKAEKALKKTQENGAYASGDAGDEEWSTKSYGKYSCRIALPENIEFEKITAEVKDGVLYLTVPKASNHSKIIEIGVQ